MAPGAEVRFMFLAASYFEAGDATRGGFLTTNVATEPLEFRCTSSIRPTKLQQMLYGHMLSEYVLCQLIGIPLFEAAKEKPNLILVNDSVFLAMRPRVTVAVLWLGRHSQAADVLPKDAHLEDYVLTHQSGKFEPIITFTHHEFADELLEARRLLSELTKEHDALEPFDRVDRALEHVHKEKTGEKQR